MVRGEYDEQGCPLWGEAVLVLQIGTGDRFGATQPVVKYGGPAWRGPCGLA